MEFSYYLPVNLIFGRGRTAEAGAITAMYGRKALVVTGRSSTKKSGLLERVIHYLKKAGVDSVVFDRVQQNPLTTTAEEAAALAKAKGCDVVLGVGGGSVLDCAKAAAFLAVNEGSIHDYIFNRLKSDQALPIVLIPTTCGTGSEGNGFAVLTNPENGDKKSLRCNAIVAKASIIDSECMMTMPKTVLAAVGFDALCHCMEAYVSRISQPLTDMMCEKAMALTAAHLLPIYEGKCDPDSWDGVTLASTLGGMVINTAGVTLPHGMEHPASGLRDIVHGKGLAALTPAVTEASIAGAPEKYGVISRILGGTGAEDCAGTIRKLLKRLNLSVTLGELGIREEDIPWMAENCMKVSAAGIANHPVVFEQEEIETLYRQAL